ncbi:MAG: insulinase family protein [Planctomycetes bacterium]|nr:insulinase family protein [Planctomycetota bacterium]
MKFPRVLTLLLAAMALLPVGCSNCRQIPGSGGPASSTVVRDYVVEGAPDHPSALVYPPLVYEPPDPASLREVLPNGMIVYIKEDHSLPTFDLSMTFRTGSLWEPADKVGLADMTGSLVRNGGTADMTPDQVNEKIEAMAGSIETSIGTTQGSASLSGLKEDIDAGLALFRQVLLQPAFLEDEIRRYRERTVQSLARRNDNPRGILSREFERLLYGSHPVARRVTKSGIERITRNDLLDFYRKSFQPGGTFVSVAGDFDRKAMIAKLGALFADWKPAAQEWAKTPEVPMQFRGGVYLVDKPRVNQGFVTIGHLGIRKDNPDIHALDVMNYILGGGSFTSRLTSRVRSDEGLAYSVGSRFGSDYLYPGAFSANYQSKAPTVLFAAQIVLEEIERLRREPVSASELDNAKNAFIERFPSNFSTAFGTVNVLADNEYNGRPMDYYAKYRDRIRAVTAEDVQRVAKQYLHPDGLAILIVGNLDKIRKGIDRHPVDINSLGTVKTLELKDPLGDDF